MILIKDLLTVVIPASPGFSSLRIEHKGTLTGSRAKRLVFDPDAVVGLEDVPAMRREASPRPYSHGVFPERGFSESRLITLSGHAFAQNAEELHELRDHLAGLLNSGTYKNYSFSFSGGTRFGSGSLSGGLSWTQRLDTYAIWKFDLVFPDPRLYGTWKYAQMGSSDVQRTGLGYNLDYPLNFTDEVASPVDTLLQNNGNSAAWPIFTLNATTNGFRIYNNAGRSVVFTGSTRRGNPVVVDFFTGNVTVGTTNTDRSYYLTKRQWWSIPANSTLMPKLDLQASPDTESNLIMDIKYRDTYI